MKKYAIIEFILNLVMPVECIFFVIALSFSSLLNGNADSAGGEAALFIVSLLLFFPAMIGFIIAVIEIINAVLMRVLYRKKTAYIVFSVLYALLFIAGFVGILSFKIYPMAIEMVVLFIVGIVIKVLMHKSRQREMEIRY